MANKDRTGFYLYNSFTQGATTGRVMKFAVASAQAVAVGDIVKVDGGADTTNLVDRSNKALATVVRATAGDVPVGLVVGMDFEESDLDRTHIDTSSTGRVLVNVDPFIVMRVQSATAVAPGSIFQNCQLSDAAPDSTTGESGQSVDSFAVTQAHNFKFIGYPDDEDNEINAANNDVLVVFNKHLFRDSAGVTGV